MRVEIETYFLTINEIDYEVAAQVIFKTDYTSTDFGNQVWEYIDEIDIREVKECETENIINPTYELEEQLKEKIAQMEG